MKSKLSGLYLILVFFALILVPILFTLIINSESEALSIFWSTNDFEVQFVIVIIFCLGFFSLAWFYYSGLQLKKESKNLEWITTYIFLADYQTHEKRYIIQNLDQKSIIARLLKDLERITANEQKLDSRMLIDSYNKSTSFGVPFVRALSSWFIIIGLIGTFIGLANTVGGLGVVAEGGGGVAVLQSKVTEVFVGLRSTFASSLVGLVFTVLILFVSNIYNSLHYRLIKETEYLFVTQWIPVLERVASTKAKDALSEFNVQAKKITEELKETSALVTKVRYASTKFDESADRFANFTKTFERAIATLQVLPDVFKKNEDLLNGLKNAQEKYYTNTNEALSNLKQQTISYSATMGSIEGLSTNLNSLSGSISRQSDIISSSFEKNTKSILQSVTEIQAVSIESTKQIKQSIDILNQWESKLADQNKSHEEFVKQRNAELIEALRKNQIDISNQVRANQQSLAIELENLIKRTTEEVTTLPRTMEDAVVQMKASSGSMIDKFEQFNERIINKHEIMIRVISENLKADKQVEMVTKAFQEGMKESIKVMFVEIQKEMKKKDESFFKKLFKREKIKADS